MAFQASSRKGYVKLLKNGRKRGGIVRARTIPSLLAPVRFGRPYFHQKFLTAGTTYAAPFLISRMKKALILQAAQRNEAGAHLVAGGEFLRQRGVSTSRQAKISSARQLLPGPVAGN